MKVTLLGTGSPLPDAHRAGPATLVSFEDEHFLIDAGRGVLMRLAAAGVGVPQLSAVLITHLHSDHITDLGDVITSRWVMTFERSPLVVVGPPGTQEVVAHIVASLGPDISYRLAHHHDLNEPPVVEVIEVADGEISIDGVHSALSCAPTDHRPVEPTVAFRLEPGQGSPRSVIIAGDTVPCDGLDRLARGGEVLVHTVIRKDLIEQIPIQRFLDTLDYHSSPAEAAMTAHRAGVGTLMLTHYVPAPPPGEEHEWTQLAAAHFDGTIIAGPDLTSSEIPSP